MGNHKKKKGIKGWGKERRKGCGMWKQTMWRIWHLNGTSFGLADNHYTT